VIFDTDILIWVQRGHEKATKLINETEERMISIQTYMELFQGARSKAEHLIIHDMLREFDFKVLPFTENIGHRAAVYVEEYTLKCNLRAGDAIIAATAKENNLVLASAFNKSSGQSLAEPKNLSKVQ
jgi:predicted nucleic acid-binding protein